LTGTGTSLALSPTSLAFGSEPIGQPTPPQTITLSNVSAAAVNFTAPTITPADYSISNNTCVSPLPAQTSCSLNISFDPIKKGARNGKLNITNNGGGGAAAASLTGTGTLN